MKPTEFHEMIRELSRKFAETEIEPIIDDLEQGGEFPKEILQKMADTGFYGIKAPRELGGAGADAVSYAIMMEEFARVSGIASVYVSMPNSLSGSPFLIAGTEAQQKKYLAPLIRGDVFICFALTEPGSGSDAGGMTSTAVEDGDEFILNGRKCFITGAPMSDYAVIFIRDPALGPRAITCFVVDMTLPGVSTGRPEDKMGILGCPTSDIILEDVRVPKDCVLGERGKGFHLSMATLDLGRLSVAAQGVGIAQGALDAALSYSKERKQFGKPISQFQSISFDLAEMNTKLTCARLLTYQAAETVDRHEDATMICAMAKYYASETAVEIVNKALQIHGGYGYIKDYPIERMYRDVRVLPIYEGTTQIQKMVIASQMLKK